MLCGGSSFANLRQLHNWRLHGRFSTGVATAFLSFREPLGAPSGPRTLPWRRSEKLIPEFWSGLLADDTASQGQHPFEPQWCADDGEAARHPCIPAESHGETPKNRFADQSRSSNSPRSFVTRESAVDLLDVEYLASFLRHQQA